MTKAERAAKAREESWSECTTVVEVRRRGDLVGNGGGPWLAVYGHGGPQATETCIEFGKSLLVAMSHVGAVVWAKRTSVRITNSASGESSTLYLDNTTPVEQLTFAWRGADASS